MANPPYALLDDRYALLSAIPSTKVGGQLAGTVSAATVLGILETGEAAQLPFGVISEGQLLKRSSGQVVGTGTGSGSGLDADTLDGIDSLGFVQTSRTISTTAPITGGGDLSANRTFALTFGVPSGLSTSNVTGTAATVPHGDHQHAGPGVHSLGGGLLGNATDLDTSSPITITYSSPTATVGLGTVAIAKGGTGQVTKAAGFDALSPLTTKGDLAIYSTTGDRLAIGSDGQILQAASSAAVGAKWVAVANHGFYHHVAGATGIAMVEVAGLIEATALTTGAPAISTLIALPLLTKTARTTSKLYFEVTTGGAKGSVAAAGIYKATSGTNLYPNALVADTGSQVTTAAGVISVVSANVLSEGAQYWLVYLCGTSAPTIRCLNVANCFPVFGMGTAFGTAPQVGLSVAQAFGALPGTFPVGATALTAVPIPAIGVDYSA